MVQIKPATLKEVPFIMDIINEFASQGKMLPVTEDEISSRITSFFIAIENGKIVGTVSAVFFYPDLVEIRSLAVKEESQNKGIARNLVKIVEEIGKERKAKIVFALTRIPEFFEKMGYEVVNKHNLPQKIYRDCISCPLYQQDSCDEVAVAKEIL